MMVKLAHIPAAIAVVTFRLSPATRACGWSRCFPRARGLALGYTLSPTTWAHRMIVMLGG